LEHRSPIFIPAYLRKLAVENSAEKQFRSNLVLRWEYMTGSALFLVWSQGFTDYEEFQPFGFGRDARTLFNTDGDNVLMIKASHMLNI